MRPRLPALMQVSPALPMLSVSYSSAHSHSGWRAVRQTPVKRCRAPPAATVRRRPPVRGAPGNPLARPLATSRNRSASAQAGAVDRRELADRPRPGAPERSSFPPPAAVRHSDPAAPARICVRQRNTGAAGGLRHKQIQIARGNKFGPQPLRRVARIDRPHHSRCHDSRQQPVKGVQ